MRTSPAKKLLGDADIAVEGAEGGSLKMVAQNQVQGLGASEALERLTVEVFPEGPKLAYSSTLVTTIPNKR